MLLTTVSGYIAAIFGLLVILFLVLFQNFIGTPYLFDRFIKFICRSLPLLFGVVIRTRGRHAIDWSRPYLLLANHVNIFDPIILYGYIPSLVTAVELESHFSWPIWGTIIKHAGMIPISHTHVKSAMASLAIVAQTIRGGTSIIILPEGHRTRDGNLGRFMRAPFRTIRQIQADIVPIAMRGLYARKSVHSLRVRPGKVEIVFGPPISADGYGEMTDGELRDTVKNTLQKLLQSE